MRIKNLEKELEIWLENDIISSSQAKKIINLYEKKSKDLGILKIFSLLFLGLFFLVIIAQNWQNFSPTIKISLLFCFTLASQLWAYFLYIKKANSNLFFLSNIIFGASLVLIAQTFNLSGDSKNLILIWAICVYLTAFSLKNEVLNLEFASLAGVYFLMSVEFKENFNFYLILLLILSMILIYKKHSKNLFFNFTILFLTGFLAYLFDYFLKPKSIIMAAFIFFFAYNLLLFFKKFEIFKSYKNSSIKFLKSFLILGLLILISFNENLLSNFSDLTLKIQNFLPLFMLLISLSFLTFKLKEKIYYFYTFFAFYFTGFLFFAKGDFTYNIFYVIFELILLGIFISFVYFGAKNQDKIAYLSGLLGIIIFAIYKYFIDSNLILTSFIFLGAALILWLTSSKYKNPFKAIKK